MTRMEIRRKNRDYLENFLGPSKLSKDYLSNCVSRSIVHCILQPFRRITELMTKPILLNEENT